MELTVSLVLLIAAAVCFALAVFNVSVRNINLTALGLLLWVLSVILQRS